MVYLIWRWGAKYAEPLGGTMPEALPVSEKGIKQVESGYKKLNKK